MEGSTDRACLLIADITGYTGYMSGVELDHAQDVVADLLGTVVSALRPGFRLAKLEGDAAFAFAPAEEIDGSMLLDKVEAAYFDFRRRMISIRQASLCECNACILIPNLDLKVVVHHGTIGRQQVAGQEELMGSDVIITHLLLKNSVERDAYALLTQQCLDATALNPEALGMSSHVEEYEHVGKVRAWVHDLSRAWRMEHERRRVYVAEADAVHEFKGRVPGDPALVWEYVTSPKLRPLWQPGVTAVEEQTEGPRRGVGTTNHCMHGEEASVEEILDWRPPRYVTGIGTMPGGLSYVYTDEVVPVDDGCEMTKRVKPRRVDDREVLVAATSQLDEPVKLAFQKLTTLLEDEIRRRETIAEVHLPTVNEGSRLSSSVREA